MRKTRKSKANEGGGQSSGEEEEEDDMVPSAREDPLLRELKELANLPSPYELARANDEEKLNDAPISSRVQMQAKR